MASLPRTCLDLFVTIHLTSFRPFSIASSNPLGLCEIDKRKGWDSSATKLNGAIQLIGLSPLLEFIFPMNCSTHCLCTCSFRNVGGALAARQNSNGSRN